MSFCVVSCHIVSCLVDWPVYMWFIVLTFSSPSNAKIKVFWDFIERSSSERVKNFFLNFPFLAHYGPLANPTTTKWLNPSSFSLLVALYTEREEGWLRGNDCYSWNSYNGISPTWWVHFYFLYTYSCYLCLVYLAAKRPWRPQDFFVTEVTRSKFLKFGYSKVPRVSRGS